MRWGCVLIHHVMYMTGASRVMFIARRDWPNQVALHRNWIDFVMQRRDWPAILISSVLGEGQIVTG